MNTLKLSVLVSAVLVLLHFPGPSQGQAPAAAKATVTIQGTVKMVWFKNPNVRYLIAVPSAAGRGDEIWDVRASSVRRLAQKGWSRDTIQVGDTVTVRGYRRKDGTKTLSILTVTLSDGTSIVDKTVD